MNKITSTLAGLALVATASIAPAFAQALTPGTFTFAGGPTPFSFSAGTPGGISLTAIPVLFNAVSGANSMGTLTLSGGTEQFGAIGTVGTFTGVTETFVSTSGPLVGFSEMGTAFVSQRSASTYDIASDTTTFTTSGTSFDLVPGSPVPEASTVVSFGALLALGGLAVVLRRKGVKNAA